MPTYRNDTKKKITFPDATYLEFYPGQTRVLRYHIPYVDLGLTLVSETPFVLRSDTGEGNRLAYFEESMASGDSKRFDFPYCEGIQLSIEATSGKAYVYYGDSDQRVLIDSTHYQVTSVAWSKVPYVIVECIEAASITIKAEDFIGPMRIAREQ